MGFRGTLPRLSKWPRDHVNVEPHQLVGERPQRVDVAADCGTSKTKILPFDMPRWL